MKIKAKDVAEIRNELLGLQDWSCALCKLPISEEEVVHLDHCHKNGWVRGALHRACNMTLGVIEGFKGNTLKDRIAFLRGAADYLELHRQDQTGLIHHTFFTPDEKKARAKRKREAKCSKKK